VRSIKYVPVLYAVEGSGSENLQEIAYLQGEVGTKNPGFLAFILYGWPQCPWVSMS
jgi:hypothetical protein